MAQRIDMSTKTLMIVSSLCLGVAGAFALFAPHELLTALGSPTTNPLPVVIQLLGALYLACAFTNWTAKDSLIGGIYARPTSLGNFTHFTVGALALAKYQLSGESNTLFLAVLIVYAVFAIVFGWLVFVYGGKQT
jgi:hypothetical protein